MHEFAIDFFKVKQRGSDNREEDKIKNDSLMIWLWVSREFCLRTMQGRHEIDLTIRYTKSICIA